MSGIIIGKDAAKLAGLQIDALQKFKVGQLSLDHLERFLNLSSNAREDRFGDGKKKNQSILEKNTFLRRLFETEKIAVGPTDGTETFVISGIFTGGVSCPTPPVVKPPVGTLPTFVAVYEQTTDGTFAQIWGSLGEKRQKFTEMQVLNFCRINSGRLRAGGYAILFELEGGFVADVHFDNHFRLRVDVNPFSNDSVWYAEYLDYFVTPL